MSSDRSCFECKLSGEDYPYLSQYAVHGRSALPAAAVIELAIAAAATVVDARHGLELRDVRVSEPVWFDAQTMQLTCALDHRVLPGSFRIETRTASGQLLLAQGQFASHAAAPSAPADRDAWPDDDDAVSCNPNLDQISLGTAYSGALRGHVASTTHARAELVRDASARLATEGYVVHPVLWQLAIESARRVLAHNAEVRLCALSIGKIALAAASQPAASIRVRRSADSAHVELLDAAGVRVGLLQDVRFAPVATASVAPGYALRWHATPPLASQPNDQGRWLVFGNSSLARAFLASLQQRNILCWQLADGRSQDVARCVLEHGIERIVYAWDDVAGGECAVAVPLSEALAELSRSAAQLTAGATRLWILTQGAHAPDGPLGNAADRPQQAALWGFGAALALEIPKLWGGMIDLSATSDPFELERAIVEIAEGGEDQLALRGRARFVPRLLPLPEIEPTARLRLRADAAYLVTGGLGGLGLEVALRLAQLGAGAIVLLGRSRARAELDKETEHALRAIEHAGARVEVFKADVADLEQMSKLAARFEAELPRVAGIIHAAGVVRFGAAAELSAQDVAAIMRCKIDGTLVLERLFLRSPLDFFVCFSSGASVWGSRGLAAYAAGSGFLDGWARSRERRGLRAVSLNWGMWARVGMSSEPERAELLAAIGLRAMEPALALDALEQAISDRAAQRVIADIDWSLFRRLYEANAPRRMLLRELHSGAHAQPRSDTTQSTVAEAAPASASATSDTRTRVRALLSQLTGVEDAAIDADAPLNTLGIDSISALDLKARLMHEFGLDLQLAEILQGASVDAVIERVQHAANAAPVRAEVIAPRARNQPPCMSFPQERLWFLEQLEPGAAVYNVPAVIRARGTIDLQRLQDAFAIVLSRHEVLRTSFDATDGAPVPVLHECVELPYVFRDLGLRNLDWMALAREELRKPFDLARAPLLRLLALRLTPDEHVIVMTMHHVVADAWSLGLLVQELMAIAAGIVGDTPPQLPELPIQFSDYAAWQRARVAQGELEHGLEYWVRELQDAPRLLELPTDHPRPAIRTAQGALMPFVLPAELSRALRDCARQHAVTPFVVCLAMYVTLLHKYSRQQTICVGVPVAGRQQPQTRSLIGFFVNTIVLRADLDPELDVRTLLTRLQATVARGLAHEDVPFERVVGSLQPPRSASHTPLFQAGLAFQNVPRSSLEVAGFGLEALEVDPGVAKFDLHLTILEKDGSYEGSLEYSTDLFEADTARGLLRHWTTLIEQATRNPALRLDELLLVDAQERERVVHTWNQTATTFGSDQPLQSLIQAQAARTPERTAITFGSTCLSYAELELLATRLAQQLFAAGVTRGHFVGVFMERSPELVVALLAILKSGAAYVPFDPSYPRARLELLARDADTRLVLTHERLRERALFEAAWAVDLAQLSTSHHSAQSLPDHSDLDACAYMLYTSGSTGTPKGALNSQRAICNRLHWMQAEMQLDGSDVVLQKTPIGFDVSVWELFWPLIAGARLVLAEPGGHRDAGYLARLIASEAVTTLHFVPSMLQTFLEEPELARLVSLRRVVCSGEALPKDLQDRALRMWPGAALYNLYGPTEAAVDVSVWRCRLEANRRNVPIGRPIANTRLYVLDQSMNPLPVGVPGELHIGGVQVGQGYHHRPELTREKFVSDPFSNAHGARLYKTGDLARWQHDGTLDYLGRIDEQIKLHGCRIEPAEIEAALRNHAAVAEAAVVVRVAAEGMQLVAYVVLAHAGVSSAELQLAMRATLPEFMLPSFVVLLHALPRSANGKLDRRALPAPDLTPRSAPASAADDTEREVLALWRELLGRDDIDVQHNFFEVGGQSLLAARLAARMSQRFETRISVAALLAAPTVQDMARLVRPAAQSHNGILVEFGSARATSTTFLVHPAGGEVGCYRSLATQLRARTRVLGIRSAALTGGKQPTDVGSMAREYVRALRKEQPKGPYNLGGWSMGGVVAFEMARQLLDAGEHVAALFIIDSLLPSPVSQAAFDDTSHLESFARDLAAMFGLDAPQTGLDRDHLLDRLHESCLNALGSAAPTRAEIALRMRVYCDNCKVMLAYRPKPLPVRLALVLSETGQHAESAFGSWASLGECAAKLSLPHDHYSLLNGPNLASLVHAIEPLLRRPPDGSYLTAEQFG